MPDKKKEDILFALLKKQGIYRGSAFLDNKSPVEKTSYPDITELVTGSERIKNSAGEVVYRKLHIPITDFAREDAGCEYQLPGEKYFHYLDPHVLARFSGIRNPLPPEEILFLDLETTGLAGGTGTYPVVSGIGYLRDGFLVLEQFLMEDFDRELACMTELHERIGMYGVFGDINCWLGSNILAVELRQPLRLCR